MGTLQRLAVSTRRDVHAAAPADQRGSVGAAYQALLREFVRALHEDPSRVVAAPGFEHVVTAADVVDDDFAGTNGEAFRHELLSIVGAAAQGEDVHLRASAWIAKAASRYAEYHADDLAHLMASKEAA